MLNLFIAQENIYNPKLPPFYNTMTGWDFAQWVIGRLIQVIFVMAVVIFLFIFFLGGYKWLTSGGETSKIASAKSLITNALIGLAVLFSIWVILQVIAYFFNVRLGGFGGKISGPTPIPISCNGVGGVCITQLGCTKLTGSITSAANCNNPPGTPIAMREYCCILPSSTPP